MNKHIKRTSLTVGMPPITISTTCGKESPFSVTSSASKSESFMSKPSLSVRRTALPAAGCKVLPSGADLADPLSPQSYVKSNFMGPQNRRDGKHTDAMIKDFRALRNNTQDPTHRAAINSGKREFIMHKSRNKTYISDEQLHAMELCIYHGIKVQVEGLEGERISQMCQCTGSQSGRGGD
jgi:hypothetical protein